MENMTETTNQKLSLRFIDFKTIFLSSTKMEEDNKEYIWMSHVYKFLKKNHNVSRDYIQGLYKITDVKKLHGEIFITFTYGKSGNKEHMQELFMSDPYLYLLEKNNEV